VIKLLQVSGVGERDDAGLAAIADDCRDGRVWYRYFSGSLGWKPQEPGEVGTQNDVVGDYQHHLVTMTIQQVLDCSRCPLVDFTVAFSTGVSRYSQKAGIFLWFALTNRLPIKALPSA
jgi:hypothetical protein